MFSRFRGCFSKVLSGIMGHAARRRAAAIENAALRANVPPASCKAKYPSCLQIVGGLVLRVQV